VIHGSCYILGGDVPGILLNKGLLDLYQEEKYGLVTSEEDAIVTMMCASLGLPIFKLENIDSTWRNLNYLGDAVLSMPLDQIPFVIHPLKPNAQHDALRLKIKEQLPFFAEGNN
jgi:hypothetical protein